LPDDVDAAFFNAAPGDQQVREIRADERLLLENLHPEQPRLVTNLELLSISATVDYGGGSVQDVRLRCDTLAIDTDRGTASLVWRGTVRLSHPAQPGRVVVTAERRGSGSVAVVPAKVAMTGSIDPSVLRRAEALPFTPAVPGSAPLATTAALPRVEEPDALPDLARAHKKFGGTAAIDPAIVRASLKLPFAPAASAPAPPPPPPPGSVPEPEPPDALPEIKRAHEKFGGTAGIDPAMLGRVGEELPFGPGASPLAQPSRAAEPADALPRLARAHLEEHWAEAIKKDLERGKVGALRAFDAAYLGRLEEERGVVTIEEYALLVVAGERGTERDVLDALGLPRGAMVRIGRVWDRKAAEDAALGKRMRKAVAEAREA
jgi:hypothetical protein